MGGISRLEDFLPRLDDAGGLAIVQHRRRHEADSAVVVLLVVPREESPAETECIFVAAAAIRELRAILHGFELVFRKRIVVGNMRPAVRKVYTAAFLRIPGLIDGSDPACTQIEESLVLLQHGAGLVEQGKIVRTQLSDRLSHYVIPASVVGGDVDAALCVPGLNKAVSSKMLLWPQVRAKWDRERACVVSTEDSGGWYHGLWLPGYFWADTYGRWQVPGMEYPAVLTAVQTVERWMNGV